MRLVSRSMTVLCAAALVGLVACGSGGGRSQSRTTRTTVPAARPRACMPNGSAVARESTSGPATLIVSADVSTRGCTDSVRFEFASAGADLAPKYSAHYEPGPFTDFNQGFQIKMSGSAYLVLTFDQTGTSLLDGKSTYRSRESITPSGMHHLQEVRMVAGPPGAVEIVIGLDSQRPFVVDGAPAPPHVTVLIG